MRLKENSTLSNPIFKSVLSDFNHFFTNVYLFLLDQIKFIKFGCLFFSICFCIFRAMFYHGFNVDPYAFYAENIEHFLRTGEKTSFILTSGVQQRFIYPFIVAILHIVFPINILFLAASVNLLAYLGTLTILKKVLSKLGFKEHYIDLYQIFLIMSYNYLNYWFNILTEGAGLFFFLIYLWFLILFIQKHSFRYFFLSFVFYFIATYTREVFVLSIILYIFVIPKWIYRIIAFILIAIFGIGIIVLIPEKFVQLDQIMGKFLRSDLFIRENFWDIFLSMQIRWKDANYFLMFLKGLLKVSILPAFIIALFFFLKRHLSQKFPKKIPQKLPFSHYKSIFLVWFFTYFIFFALYYTVYRDATGLRFWFPISWIPFLFLINEFQRSDLKKYNFWKVLFIFILIFYPFFWSTGEIYVNREDPAGTGSFLYPNYYYNDLHLIESITTIDPGNFKYAIEERDLLSLKIDDLQTTNQTTTCTLTFKMWINVSSSFDVELCLNSNSNITHIVFLVYTVKENFAPGLGNLTIIQEIQSFTNQFQFYRFHYDIPIHIRGIQIEISGYYGGKFGLDSILITSAK